METSHVRVDEAIWEQRVEANIEAHWFSNEGLFKDFVGAVSDEILWGSAMRYLLWMLKLALFALVLAFAVKNTGPVTVRYYLGGEWQSPLIFVLLVAFCAGVAIGLGAGLAHVFRLRREIAALKGKLGQINHHRDTEGTERKPELAGG